jgi:hypothetical protein
VQYRPEQDGRPLAVDTSKIFGGQAFVGHGENVRSHYFTANFHRLTNLLLLADERDVLTIPAGEFGCRTALQGQIENQPN